MSSIVLALSAALFVWMIQRLTIPEPPRHQVSRDWVVQASAVRGILTFTVFLCCYSVFPRMLQAVFSVLVGLLQSLLHQYFIHYGRPLRYPLLWLRCSLDAGLPALIRLVDPHIAGKHAAWAVLQVSIVASLPREAPPPHLLLFSLLAALAIGVAAARRIRSRFGRPEGSFFGMVYGSAFGYSGLWVQDLLVQKRSRRAHCGDRAPQPERIELAPIAFRNLVVVQIESLSLSPILLQEGDPSLEVAPFFRTCLREGSWFKVCTGSEGLSFQADFALITGQLPSADWIPYSAPSLECLPSVARSAITLGYTPTFYHGVTRQFYSRGAAMSQLGFATSYFFEDIGEARESERFYWGVHDAAVTRIAAAGLRSSTSPQFQFVITVSSHAPYTFIPECEPLKSKLDVLAAPPRARSYFASMAYVDRVVSDMFSSAPDGTLFLLYGDHPPNDLRKLETRFPGIGEVPLLFAGKGAAPPSDIPWEDGREISHADISALVTGILRSGSSHASRISFEQASTRPEGSTGGPVVYYKPEERER